MNEIALVILPAGVAGAMAFLVRAGASPSLRTAIRTTAVLFLGWSLAYQTHAPVSWSSIEWRIWLMIGISVLALGLSWGLYFRDASLPQRSQVAVADRVNGYMAAALALLLILGDAPQRYAFAVLMVSGAVILAAKRG